MKQAFHLFGDNSVVSTLIFIYAEVLFLVAICVPGKEKLQLWLGYSGLAWVMSQVLLLLAVILVEPDGVPEQGEYFYGVMAVVFLLPSILFVSNQRGDDTTADYYFYLSAVIAAVLPTIGGGLIIGTEGSNFVREALVPIVVFMTSGIGLGLCMRWCRRKWSQFQMFLDSLGT